MKNKRVFVVLLALALTLATGCTRRNDNSGTSAPESIPDVVSAIEDEVDDLFGDAEEDISRVEDNLMGGEDDESGLDDPDTSIASDGEYSADEDGRVDDNEEGQDLEDSEAAAAMSTDFNEIGALAADKQGWGPGGPVDAQNRPESAVAFQQQYKEYGAYFIAPSNNNIYLTFDEGYENGYTASILDTLKEKDVKAVFFITYDYAKSEPDLVRRMVTEGHILGNHSTKHKSFPDLSMEEAMEDIQHLHNYVKAYYGYEMHLFRPPMGEFSEQTLALADSLGYKTVFWSFAYRDWEVDSQPLTIEALDTIVSRCHPGAIYLLHAVSETNTQVLGDAIDALKAKGYTFARWDW